MDEIAGILGNRSWMVRTSDGKRLNEQHHIRFPRFTCGRPMENVYVTPVVEDNGTDGRVDVEAWPSLHWGWNAAELAL